MEVSLHPYFDDIDERRWLRAMVVESHPAALVFRVEPPAVWDDVLRHRVRHHFTAFRLAELYATEAAEELLHIRYQLQELYRLAGLDAVMCQLQDAAISCAHARRNGWRTAAYEAWAASDWFCNGGFG
jgi:hypothetical protein